MSWIQELSLLSTVNVRICREVTRGSCKVKRHSAEIFQTLKITLLFNVLKYCIDRRILLNRTIRIQFIQIFPLSIQIGEKKAESRKPMHHTNSIKKLKIEALCITATASHHRSQWALRAWTASVPGHLHRGQRSPNNSLCSLK